MQWEGHFNSRTRTRACGVRRDPLFGLSSAGLLSTLALGRVIAFHPVAPALFGAIEGIIRTGDQRGVGRQIRIGDAGAHAEADGQVIIWHCGVFPVERFHRLTDTFGQSAGVVVWRFRQQDSQFFAAIACNQIRLALDLLTQVAARLLRMSSPARCPSVSFQRLK